MQKIAIVLTCLACASNGRRVQNLDKKSQSTPSAEDLATLLLARDTAGAFFGQMPSMPSTQKLSKRMKHGPTHLSPPTHLQATQRTQAKGAHDLAVDVHEIIRRSGMHKFVTQIGDKGFDFHELLSPSGVRDFFTKIHKPEIEIGSHTGLDFHELEEPEAEAISDKAENPEFKDFSRRSMLKLLGAGIVGVAAGSKLGPTGKLALTEWKLKQAEEDLGWKNSLAGFLGLVATGEAIGLMHRRQMDAQASPISEITPWNAREAGLTSGLNRQFRESRPHPREAALEEALYDALAKRRIAAREAAIHKYRAESSKSAAKDQAKQMEVLKAREAKMQRAITRAAAELDAADALNEATLEQAEKSSQIALQEAAAKASKAVDIAIQKAAADKKAALEAAESAKAVALQEAAAKAADEAREATLKAEAAKAGEVLWRVKQTMAEVRERAEEEKAAAVKEAEEAAEVKLSAAKEQLAAAESALAVKEKLVKVLKKSRKKAMKAKTTALQALEEKKMLDKEHAKVLEAERSPAVQDGGLRQTRSEKADAEKEAALQDAEEVAAVKLSAAMEEVSAAWSALADKEESYHKEIVDANEAKRVALHEVENQKHAYMEERKQRAKEQKEMAEVLKLSKLKQLAKIKSATAGKGFEIKQAKPAKSAKKSKSEKKVKLMKAR